MSKDRAALTLKPAALFFFFFLLFFFVVLHGKKLIHCSLYWYGPLIYLNFWAKSHVSWCEYCLVVFVKKKKNNIKIVCEIFIHMKMKNPKIFKLPQLLKNSSRNSTVSGHSVFQVIHVSSTLSYPHNKKVTLSQTFRYLINSADPVRLILITFPPFHGFSVCYS